mmetsp:Transcript_16819/g.54780  ORF Transcript_16819/g.54780 Transcript_16819/m.54780 type:complete len:202 (-) Transcript_16819:744-1349(-)
MLSAPSATSRDGSPGRKSLPTSMHRNTKSSTARSCSHTKPSELASTGGRIEPARHWRSSSSSRKTKSWSSLAAAAAAAAGLEKELSWSRGAGILPPRPPPRDPPDPRLAPRPRPRGANRPRWNFCRSRSRLKWVSCVIMPSMIRSASSPYMQWRVASGEAASARASRMKSMILCSPSPGTSAPEKITVGPCCHFGSVCIFV